MNLRQKPRVLFITSSLELGGAERQLLLLCEALASRIDVQIFSLVTSGPLLDKYRASFPNIECVDSRKKSWLMVFNQIRKRIVILKPDLVITWLYRADILGGIATKSVKNTPVIWSVRNSKIPNFEFHKKYILVLLSYLIPRVIVANGIAAFNFHRSIGYPKKKMLRIPNLLSKWTSSTVSRSKLLTSPRPLAKLRVGIASRQIAGKGIMETIKNVENLPSDFPKIELSLIGQESDDSKIWKSKGIYKNHTFDTKISDEELSSWFAGLDLYLMPSTSWESQPNSLLEAIAIGCPVLCSNLIELEVSVSERQKFNPRDSESFIRAFTSLLEISHIELSLQSEISRKHLLKNLQQEVVLQDWLNLIESCRVRGSDE
jgi:glycosyltransferase involved in cell wall biosynthesis